MPQHDGTVNRDLELDAWLARCLDPTKMLRDSKVPVTSRLAFILMTHGTTDVYFLTSRKEELRDVTTRWLRRHDLFRGNARLIMRADDDKSTCVEYKLRAMDAIVKMKRPEMVLVMDDLDGKDWIDGCAERGFVLLQAHLPKKHLSPQEE